jgi:hypothetical protein
MMRSIRTTVTRDPDVELLLRDATQRSRQSFEGYCTQGSVQRHGWRCALFRQAANLHWTTSPVGTAGGLYLPLLLI